METNQETIPSAGGWSVKKQNRFRPATERILSQAGIYSVKHQESLIRAQRVSLK